MDANVCLLQCKRLGESSDMDRHRMVTLPSFFLGQTKDESRLGAISLSSTYHSTLGMNPKTAYRG